MESSGSNDASARGIDLDQCVEHEELATHMHVGLVPVLNRQPQALPSGIGIEPGCLRPLHTHGPDFVIHVEYPTESVFTLGDFFLVWGDENPYREVGFVGASVNGEPYEGDYRTLILEDGQRIVIEFGL